MELKKGESMGVLCMGSKIVQGSVEWNGRSMNEGKMKGQFAQSQEFSASQIIRVN